MYSYLTYGPYGSYQPTFDNRLSDLVSPEGKTKDQGKEDQIEKNTLLKIYGGEKELLYVQSLQVLTMINLYVNQLYQITNFNSKHLEFCS